MKIIDPHIHLFDLLKGKYHWLKPQNPPFWPDKALIRHDFSQDDLALGLAGELTGFVHLEAGFDNEQPYREIEWLEQHVKGPFKSIAHLALDRPLAQVEQHLAKLLEYTSVVGVRHLLDEQAVEILSQQRVRDSLNLIAQKQLIFETQISGLDDKAVEQLTDVANRFPQLTIILSHGCFCPNNKSGVDHWQRNIERLAQCQNIFIKASGWEMVARDYQTDDVARVVSTLVASFGVTRVMFASNFPLCLFSAGYDDLWTKYQKLGLNEQTWQALSFSNAQRIYRF